MAKTGIQYFWGYSLTATGPIIPTPSSSILGDANADGTIDASDASEILSMYTKNTLNKTTPSSAELARCDVNNDGNINAVDASSVLAYYAIKAMQYQKLTRYILLRKK